MFGEIKKVADWRSRLSARDRKGVVRAALLVIVTIGFLFPVMIMLILAQGRQSVEFSEQLDRSFGRRILIRNLLEALQDAETNQIAYFLTADPQFLQLYQDASATIPSHLDAVTLNGMSLGTDVSRLRSLVGSKLAELNLAMIVRQLEGAAAAVAITRGETARAYTEEIRSLIDEIRSKELLTSHDLSAKVRKQAVVWETITLLLLSGIAIAIVIASIAVAIDLRRRRRIERELKTAQQLAQRAREEAERASAAKTDFLATMSHEIRTPLSGVIGYTELLLDSRGLSREQRDYVDHIQEASSALLTVVNDVLDFSRVEVGEVLLVAEPFSLPELIDNAVSIIRSLAQKKKLPIHVDADPALPECLLGDAARLRQVLLNLLNNAVKFTEEGSVTLQVRHTGSSEEGECLRFSVIDTGPGIAPEQQDRLFKRFSQLDQPARRRFGGAGLGLAISKRFIELMGGQIGVESAEGLGSTFWFEVPLPRAEPPRNRGGETDIVQAHARPGRILVVDDLDQNRDLARTMLEAAGHEVDVAADGSEAISAVQAKPYDLVLMDVQMADMDGTEATRAIRSLDHPARDIPIIAITANVLPQDVRTFRAAGMNDHLGKPYTRAQLLSKVRASLTVGAAEIVTKEVSNVTEPAIGLESLCQFMGAEWVAQGLAELKGHLEDTFLEMDPENIDREQLAQKTHMMVSRSSIFGFSDFAHLCIKVEEACRANEDLLAVFEEGRSAAVEVHRTASEMLERLHVNNV